MALRDLLAPEARRAMVTAALVLSGALATTFAIRALSERAITADMQRRFAADSADIATAIGERLRTHAEVLVSMQGLYASIGRVDRAQFRRYIDVLDLARRYPGFQALQSLRHVKPDGLDTFLAEVRGDISVDPAGQPDFSIRPPGQRPFYNVVEFVEPMRGNEDALGFDAGANPVQLDSLAALPRPGASSRRRRSSRCRTRQAASASSCARRSTAPASRRRRRPSAWLRCAASLPPSTA